MADLDKALDNEDEAFHASIARCRGHAGIAIGICAGLTAIAHSIRWMGIVVAKEIREAK